MALHPIHRRYHAEDLIRLRRSDEPRRFVASQRSGRIDPNPHQVDAVIFALARIPDGGAILADEVGLGKTIEAGLVIAQLRSEGARRVLLVTPKALLGQWRQELATLFAIEVTEASAEPATLRGEGVFAIGRERAGSEKGAAALAAAEPFDLCVIDEAHEVFAGIYRRFDRWGTYDPEAPHAKMAARLRDALEAGGAPVLLLTATPIQNSLPELWGLVQYVDRSDTLLGDLATFRAMFCDGDDRQLRSGQEHELRRRVGVVCRRTLRRQAQEFMARPFVERCAKLFDYSMSAAEKSLYDDVTRYLLEPGIEAFRGGRRRLLLIGFHRRMASSLAALAASLEKVAERLRGMLGQGDAGATLAAFAADLEDDELGVDGPDEELDVDATKVRAELARVEDFLARAASLPTDSKARALLRAVSLVLERGRSGAGSGKLVVFTESLTTQDYLRDLLLQSGVVSDDEITLFRGQNQGPRAAAALRRWDEEVGAKMPRHRRPSRSIAMRLALVHEFASRSKVFVATEAGAKGLNLQFCDTLVNYDLPWNPQRIEQRIGRCHRYGQERGVTVINFLNRDNAAQRLTLEILSQKLDLFGTVLDASDVVLHEPAGDASDALASALGPELEAELRRIYERARTIEEIDDELRTLRGTLDERRRDFDQTQRRTAGLIESRLDEAVRQVFRRLQDDLPRGLAELDSELSRVACGYLDAIGADYVRESEQRGTALVVQASDRLPDEVRDGGVLWIGDRPRDGADAVHPAHPLIRAAVREARAATAQRFHVALRPAKPVAVVGQRGRMVVVKARYGGFETVEHLLPVVVLEGEAAPLDDAAARDLLAGEIEDLRAPAPVSDLDAAVDDAVDEVVFVDQAATAAQEQDRFQRAMEQVERFIEDRVLLLKRRRTVLLRKLERVEGRRDEAVGADARTRAERELASLQGEIDEIEQRIAVLQARDDRAYAEWRDRLHARRYSPPEVTRILDLDFELR